ncbi:bifunctional 3'-5' exonuclease/DNA polymerase, partial [Microbacterium sp. C7(2022)]|nr:bifunctional 3'-5' exonuclease/DNA polymerase [Microbacterium sp. C7(2022)]
MSGTVVLGRKDAAQVAVMWGNDEHPGGVVVLPDDSIAEWIGRVEAESAPRWVWNDTVEWYPQLLAAGVRVARCHDLRLAHVVLRHAATVGAADEVFVDPRWNVPARTAETRGPTLFDWDSDLARLPSDIDDAVAEYQRQLSAINTSADPNRLRMLCAAESAGALIAAELHDAGLPWDRSTHERILEDSLGTRDATGVPHRVASAAAEVRAALGDPVASLDSQPKLLRAGQVPSCGVIPAVAWGWLG